MESGTPCTLSPFLPHIGIQNLRAKLDPIFTEVYHIRPINKASLAFFDMFSHPPFLVQLSPVEGCRDWDHTLLALNFSSNPSSWMILGKLLNLHEPLLIHLYNGLTHSYCKDFFLMYAIYILWSRMCDICSINLSFISFSLPSLRGFLITLVQNANNFHQSITDCPKIFHGSIIICLLMIL